MRRVLIPILAAAVLIATPEFAAAKQKPPQQPTQKPPQPATQKPPARPARPKPPVGFRVFGLVDVNFMAAKNTFDATTGSSMLIGYGGGADITNLWRGLFVRGAVSFMSADGERVAISGDEVIPLGIDLNVSMTPIEIGAGWRVPAGRRQQVTPYVGGGLLLLNYKETGEFAATGDDSNESFTGTFLMGGIDFAVGRRISVGFEGQYRMVPNAIGEGGVSAEFDEDNLGGFTFRAMFGIRK